MLLNRFIADYIECAIWAENDDSSEWARADLSDDARKRLTDDATAFYNANRDDCEAYSGHAGHDFWLTRRGHGCGFWEQSDAVSQRLDAAAKAAGDCELYLGDDGKIYAV